MAGIYIHVPFCKQACHYCNFHFSTNLTLQNDFTAALLKEMELRVSYLGSEPVETIYIGGGTPSLLPVAVIHTIMEALERNFQIVQTPEITLEANPDDMDAARLEAWQESGINRLSIGVQSFFADDLAWMNRAHDAGQALRPVHLARSAGFENFSLDLIYGSPGLTDAHWEENLQMAIGLDPAHLSCYALTVEPKTALFKSIRLQKMADVEPERQADQFLTGIRILEEAGYEQYEISSFAKPGKRSRHNSSYWQSKKYLGLGPSAHSFDGRSRQWNIASNPLYIRSLNAGVLNFESEILLPRDMLNEYIMTSLRTIEGLDLDFVAARFGNESGSMLEENASIYIRKNQIVRRKEKLILTADGKLFADGIAASLFFD